MKKVHHYFHPKYYIIFIFLSAFILSTYQISWAVPAYTLGDLNGDCQVTISVRIHSSALK